MSKGPRAVQLISIDENRQLKLEDEAVKIIQSFNDQCRNFAVVCVVGKYRTGKSYLINQVLLQQSQGFQVGSTINACTKGLWMWSELIYFESGKSKEPIPTILIDTEGIGSVEEEQNHDVKIFLLAMLMSSYFIYNSVGNIDDMALQNLGLIVNLTKMLQKADETTQKDLFDTFPSFLWILRDFTLRLEDEFANKITAKEYLENALKPLKGFSEAIENKNKIRRHITQFFQERDCVTLVRPTQDEKDLQHLTSMKFENLRIEFQEQILALRKKFSFKIQQKQYKGRPTTPYSFVEMCKHFVQTINEGNLPVIESQWQMICRQEINRTLLGGVEIYKQLVSDLLQQNGITREVLESQHLIFARKVKSYLEYNCLDKDSDEFKLAKKTIKSSIDQLCKEAQDQLDQIHQTRLDVIKQEFLDQLNYGTNFIENWDLTITKIWQCGANQQLVSDYTKVLQKALIEKLQSDQQTIKQQLNSKSDNEVQLQEIVTITQNKLKQSQIEFQEQDLEFKKQIVLVQKELEFEKNKNIKLQQQLQGAQQSIDNKVGEYMLKFKSIEKSYNDQLKEKTEAYTELEAKLKQVLSENDRIKALAKQQESLNSSEILQLKRDIDKLKDELQDRNETITKIKQQQGDESMNYYSLQTRKKGQNDNVQDTLKKEFYEFQIQTLQQQLDEQKKLSSDLLSALQTQNQPPQYVQNNDLLMFMQYVHQLIGAYVSLQSDQKDDNYKKYSQAIRGLQQLTDNDQSCLMLSERVDTKNSDMHLRIEKTMSSSSPKMSKSTNQNINPFRSPEQKYSNSKMTIMQMFMQQKNKDQAHEKIRKSSQIENLQKNRNNIHVQRKVF